MHFMIQWVWDGWHVFEPPIPTIVFVGGSTPQPCCVSDGVSMSFLSLLLVVVASTNMQSQQGEFVELDFRLEFGMNRGLVEVAVPRIHRIFGCGLEGHLHHRRQYVHGRSQDVWSLLVPVFIRVRHLVLECATRVFANTCSAYYGGLCRSQLLLIVQHDSRWKQLSFCLFMERLQNGDMSCLGCVSSVVSQVSSVS